MTAVLDFDPHRRTNAQAIFDLAHLDLIRRGGHCPRRDSRPRGRILDGLDRRPLADRPTTSTRACEHSTTGMPARPAPWPAVRSTSSCSTRLRTPPRGTAKTREIDARFGTTEYRSPAAVEQLIIDGMVECLRVCSRLTIVKVPGCVRGVEVPAAVVPRVGGAASKVGARLVAELYVVRQAGRNRRARGR